MTKPASEHTALREALTSLNRTQQMRVRDLIDRAIGLHRDAAQHYATLRATHGESEEGLYLGHLIEHEERVAESLEAYKEEAPSTVLETWFKYAPDLSQAEALGALHEKTGATSGQISEIAEMISSMLSEVYDALAEGSPVENVRDVINDLRELENREKIRAMRSRDS